MAEQKMHLPLETLKRIITGKQVVEARLFDQRRRKLVVGDTIVLFDSEKKTSLVKVTIAAIRSGKDFGELFDYYGSVKLGGAKTLSKEDYLAKMNTLYYPPDVQRLGVIGIEFAKEKILQGMWYDPHFKKVLFTWHPTVDFKKYIPITQCYGICLNDAGEVLIGRCKKVHGGKWILPGGIVEYGKDPIKTLHREVDEEISITITKPTLLGVQQVEFLDKEDDDAFQLRFVAMIKKYKELTPNPDTGDVWERKFIPLDELNTYLKWGFIGQELVHLAQEWFAEKKKKKKSKAAK
ncbi:NUDIX domain-containing protein [Candidatus Woesearchaeota archaeon]|nr:NUDIX domain-containing protein [Candidatus Woesearchaeota archaeon]